MKKSLRNIRYNLVKIMSVYIRIWREKFEGLFTRLFILKCLWLDFYFLLYIFL